MIKCNVKVCGTVFRAATERNGSDGEPYASFPLAVPIPATKGDAGSMTVFVSAKGVDANLFTKGRIIALEGELTIKGGIDKKPVFNLTPTKVEYDSKAAQGISGEMQFRGTVCREIQTPQAKDGTKYIRFSAYSTDKVKDEFRSAFVRFVQFDKTVESFLVPKAKIEAKGDLRITTFNGTVDIACKISELKEWVKIPF